MAEPVTHNFVSAKTQSPDTTLVSKNEWNDGHAFNGGVNGQTLIYDNTQPNNMRWIDGPSTNFNVGSIVSSTTTPIVNLALITKISNSPVIGSITVNIDSLTTVGAAAFVMEIQIDGVTITGATYASGLSPTSRTVGFAAAAGSHTYSLRVTTSGGVNVLTALVSLNVDTSGV